MSRYLSFENKWLLLLSNLRGMIVWKSIRIANSENLLELKEEHTPVLRQNRVVLPCELILSSFHFYVYSSLLSPSLHLLLFPQSHFTNSFLSFLLLYFRHGQVVLVSEPKQTFFHLHSISYTYYLFPHFHTLYFTNFSHRFSCFHMSTLSMSLCFPLYFLSFISTIYISLTFPTVFLVLNMSRFSISLTLSLYLLFKSYHPFCFHD